jgi:tetratricopeptide (TPR) repeat protein
MHPYGVREVEKLLGLARSTIRGLVGAGFVSPARGPRRAWQFSFRDLIVLRTAQALVAAKVPRRRITRSVKELRRHLPDSMPLSGLSICAVADRVVVKEGKNRWQAESGQYLLAFEGNPDNGSLSVITPASVDESPDAQGWFERGEALEDHDPEASLQAYDHALAAEPSLLDAWLNRGWLLHKLGRLAEAERSYRDAIERCGSEALLQFNLGVLLEDLERKAEAMEAYEAALRADSSLADCHYNLALLCEDAGRAREAIRHLAQYRRLTDGKSR